MEMIFFLLFFLFFYSYLALHSLSLLPHCSSLEDRQDNNSSRSSSPRCLKLLPSSPEDSISRLHAYTSPPSFKEMLSPSLSWARRVHLTC